MSNASESGERKSIGDRTGVQLSVLLSVAAFVIGGIWWAATINTKVDSILTLLAANAKETALLQAQFADHERRLWRVEQSEQAKERDRKP